MEKTMSDSEEKQRPNAKYRLSYENTEGREPVYHYNRDRRLEKAPQSVRNLYNQPTHKRPNLLRPLVDSKPKLMMFVSIILICIIILVLSILGFTGQSYNLEGNSITIRAVKFEDAVIIVLKKTIKKNFIGRQVQAYTGAVDIAVTAPDIPEENVFFYKIFLTLEPEESYRFAVPFNNDELSIIMQTERRIVTATIKPE